MNSMYDESPEQESQEPSQEGEPRIIQEIKLFEARYFLQIKLAGTFLLLVGCGLLSTKQEASDSLDFVLVGGATILVGLFLVLGIKGSIALFLCLLELGRRGMRR